MKNQLVQKTAAPFRVLALTLTLLPAAMPAIAEDSAAPPAAEAKPAAAKEAQPARTPEEDYKEGVKAMENGNIIEAMQPFKRAADAGHAAAQVAVAELYLSSDFWSDAATYYRKAAEQGNAEGQYGLAVAYREGRGIAKDSKQALEWFVKAAEQKHAEAINALAEAYANGGMDLTAEERKSKTAFRWIETSARQDNLLAIRALAYAYREGAFGAPVDVGQARQWDDKAKEIEAKFNKKKKGRKG